MFSIIQCYQLKKFIKYEPFSLKDKANRQIDTIQIAGSGSDSDEDGKDLPVNAEIEGSTSMYNSLAC